MSLTGDALTDRLVPVAGRLVCAIRERDGDEIHAAFAEAEAVAADAAELEGRVNGAEALCVVLAAMVPWHETPARLMEWLRHRDEFDALVQSGVAPAVAADVIERRSRGG